MTRRELLASATMTTLLVWPGSAVGAETVEIAAFSPAGRLLGTRRLSKVVRPDAEWQKLLSPLAYEVTRHADTERPFTGPGWDNHADGLYRCICCANALFDSRTKYDSGTGWPSFWRPIAATNVTETRERGSFDMRTAVSCALCDAHLGHVFSDGPRPTGLRYCMNAVALHFVPRILT